MPIDLPAQDSVYARELHQELGVRVLAPASDRPRKSIPCTKTGSRQLQSEDGLSLSLTKHRLGQGAYGVVVSGFLKTPEATSPLLVAVKKVRLKKSTWHRKAPHIARQLGHRELRREFEAADTCAVPAGAPLLLVAKKKSYLVLPHLEASFGEITALLAPLGLAEAHVMRAAPRLFSELATMHARGYTHLDIKDNNLLLSGASLHLADFGLSRGVTKGNVELTWYGTRWCSAPETLAPQDEELDLQKSDVFALGLTLMVGSTGGQGRVLQCMLTDLTSQQASRDGYLRAHRLRDRCADPATGRLEPILPSLEPNQEMLLKQFEACAARIENPSFRALLLSTVAGRPEARPSADAASRRVPSLAPAAATNLNAMLESLATVEARRHAHALREAASAAT